MLLFNGKNEFDAKCVNLGADFQQFFDYNKAQLTFYILNALKGYYAENTIAPKPPNMEEKEYNPDRLAVRVKGDAYNTIKEMIEALTGWKALIQACNRVLNKKKNAYHNEWLDAEDNGSSSGEE